MHVGQHLENFTLIYTMFTLISDLASDLGVTIGTFWRYLICLAFEATRASSVAFFLDRTSEVTMLQDRHISQNGLLSRRVPDLYYYMNWLARTMGVRWGSFYKSL